MSSPIYAAATARADKLLEPDGSVKTASGTVVSGPSAAGAAAYSSATARADKLLEPDGSIVTSGSGTSGSTPPGGTSGQVQYNNAGVFAGAPILTDGTNVAVGTSSVPANPLTVGAGANNYLTVIPPGGTYSGAVAIRPSGSGGNAYIYTSAGNLQISGNNGGNVTIGYPASSSGHTVSTNGGHVDFFQITGATAGGSPSISAIGSDTNINMNHLTKGTGAFVIQSGAALSNQNALQINKTTGAQIAAIQVNEAGGTASLMLSGTTLGITALPGSAAVQVNGHLQTYGGYSMIAQPNSAGAIALSVTNSAASVTGNYVQVTTQGQPAGDILKVDGTGKTTLKQAILTLANVPVYANNTAATGGGLTAGMLYRTGADPDQLCIVH